MSIIDQDPYGSNPFAGNDKPAPKRPYGSQLGALLGVLGGQIVGQPKPQKATGVYDGDNPLLQKAFMTTDQYRTFRADQIKQGYANSGYTPPWRMARNSYGAD